MSEATLAVKLEISDAEPGEAVDFAPRPLEDQAQIRRVGNAS
jgi:hypothetical protein